MTKLLLNGVAGTGKSTVVRHIQTNHGFFQLVTETSQGSIQAAA